MGGCQDSTVLENDEDSENIIESNQLLKYPYPQEKKTNEDIEESIKKQREEFPDLKEWKGDRYRGIGIKKMKGYKCTLPIDKLNEKREKFWMLRNSRSQPNYKIWRIINQAVVYDELRANILLEENELTTADGCINHIIDKTGNHYIVPNYCINDPYFEKIFEVEEDVEEEKIKLQMYYFTENKTFNLEISNLLTGEELKEKFKEKAKLDKNVKLRLFFAGKEINDDHFIYQHELKDNFKVQVMKAANTGGDKCEKNESALKEKKHKKKKKKSSKKMESNTNNTEINEE